MYEIDARTEWTPLIGDFLNIAPWQMEDLTPPELEAAHAWAGARAERPVL